MKLTVEEIPNGFHAQLSYTEQKTSTDIPNVSEKLTDNQQKIIDAIRINRQVTYAELAKIVGIAPTNIARNVKKLVQENRINRIGPAKGGHWKIIE